MKKLLYKSMAMAMAASFVASSAGPALRNVNAAQEKNVRGGQKLLGTLY